MDLNELSFLLFIIAYSTSCFFMIILLYIFISFPKKFMKHPNDIYFYSLVFQFLYFLFFLVSLSYLYVVYFDGVTINLIFINFLAIVTIFFMQVNFYYILALNCEIVLKLFRKSILIYKKRKMFYHIVSLAVPLISTFIYLAYTDFTERVIYEYFYINNTIFRAVFWFSVVANTLLISMVASYMKKLISTKSKGLLTLTIVTIITILDFIFSFTIPGILVFIENEKFYPIYTAITVYIMFGFIGFFQFVIIICNKKSLGFLKSKIMQKMRKGRKKSLVSFFDNETSKSVMLKKINQCDSLKNDEELLSDIFDSITKTVNFI